MSQNKILKDIAVKLGGTVGANDNDTNELLGIIRDNVSTGGSGGGGSNVAKLVATAYASESVDHLSSLKFKLTTPLKPNQFYLIKYYNDVWGTWGKTLGTTSVQGIDGNGNEIIHFSEDIFISDGSNVTILTMVYGYMSDVDSDSNNSFAIVNLMNNNSFEETIEMDLIEVYELPFTLY